MKTEHAPTYSKDLRERAKREGLHMYSLDFIRPDGSREMFAQGPITKAEGRVLVDAWLEVLRMKNESRTTSPPSPTEGGHNA